MADMMEKMQSLLSDPESMQQLQALAQMMQADETVTEAEPKSEVDTQSADTTTASSGLDFGALMKVSQLMGAAGDDADTALLLALKPHLQAERQKKVEKAVKLLKLLSVWTMLKESGMLKELL